MHNHLHPKEVGLIRMLQVLVWSEDQDLENQAKAFINDEFGEYIFLLNLENLSAFEGVDKSKHPEMLDKYDFHLIKLEPTTAHLILKNDERIVQEYDDLETVLEEFSRRLITFYHENMEDD